MVVGKCAPCINEALAARIVCRVGAIILPNQASANEPIACNQGI